MVSDAPNANELLATREFKCIASGDEFTLTVSIGRPYQPQDSNGSWRCPVSMQPYIPRLPDIGGYDSWQAVTLAMKLVESQLRSFMRDGGRLYYPGTDTEFSFDEGSRRDGTTI